MYAPKNPGKIVRTRISRNNGTTKNTPERIIVMEYWLHTGTEKERKLISVLRKFFIYGLKICVVVIHRNLVLPL